MPHATTIATAADADAAAAESDQNAAVPPAQGADAIIGGKEAAASSGSEDDVADSESESESESGLANTDKKNANDDKAVVKESDEGKERFSYIELPNQPNAFIPVRESTFTSASNTKNEDDGAAGGEEAKFYNKRLNKEEVEDLIQKRLNDQEAHGVVQKRLNDQEAHGVVQRYLEKLNNDNATSNSKIMDEQQEERSGGDQDTTDGELNTTAAVCRCTKSKCILLYCHCFGNGRACQDTCYCRNCENPKGVNTKSPKHPSANRSERLKREMREASVKLGIAIGPELAESSKDAPDAKNVRSILKVPGQRITMLTVSPGRLGITLAMVPEGGARIMAIDPACTFKAQVQVGDRIVTIDDKNVAKMDDVKINRDRMRKFGIVRKVAAISTTAEDNKDGGTKKTVSDKKARPADGQDAVGAKEASALYASPSPTKKRTTMTSVVAELNEEIAKLREQNRQLQAGQFPELDMLRTQNGILSIGNAKLQAEVDHLKLALQEEVARRSRLIVRDPSRKQTFPSLNNLNLTGDDRDTEVRREDLLRELLQFDKKKGKDTTVRMGAGNYQVLWIPLKSRRSTAEKRELNNQTFHRYNKQSKFFEKFLNAWAQYASGTQEDAADMILFYMAKRWPVSYVKNFDVVAKKTEKIIGPKPPELPPGFVSYDDTNDVRWNTMYAELVKHKEEHGDCKPNSKQTSLGKWVCGQRSARRVKNKSLTDKRIELLDELGFVWEARPENWRRQIRGGDPRENRAIAAKLVYPDLTMREALYLGGFEEADLNVIRDPKYTWRTYYVLYKDKVKKHVENYEIARRTGARLEVEKLVNILRSEDEDRFQKVFAEKSELVPYYLEAAEERRRNGITEEPLKKKQRREKEEDEQQQEEEVYESEHSEVEHEDQPLGEAEVDFHAQAAHEHTNADHMHWR